MKALIVDDSRAMRLVVARIVQRLGFETVQAEHGQAALDVLEVSDELPEVALVDWNMPVMDGLELIKALRAQPRYRGITLMMVTTESEQSRIVQALAAGAHEYLIKPFTEEALEDKLSLLGLLPTPVDAEAVAW